MLDNPTRPFSSSYGHSSTGIDGCVIMREPYTKDEKMNEEHFTHTEHCVKSWGGVRVVHVRIRAFASVSITDLGDFPLLVGRSTVSRRGVLAGVAGFDLILSTVSRRGVLAGVAEFDLILVAASSPFSTFDGTPCHSTGCAVQ